MTLNGSIEKRIADALEDMSPKQKRLARFVLDSKYYMSFASASQAAEKTDTSAATVVRFAQLLGYEGYSEMQAALRAELPSYLTAVERIQARLNATPSLSDIPQTVFVNDIKNIEQTARYLVSSQLNQAVEVVVTARHILVVGAGISGAAVAYFAHSLNVIGLFARPSITGGLPLAVDLAQLTSQDVLICIDLWRYTRSSLQAVQAAKKIGAATIAITDSIVAPVAAEAGFAFEVSAEGAAHSLSPVAIISLINVFIAELSYRVPDRVMGALRQVDSAYHQIDLLLPD